MKIVLGLVFALAPSVAFAQDREAGAAFGFVVLIGLLFLYFVPMIVAIARNHSQTAPIVILNIFLGWTLIGWVGALVWAFTNQEKTPVYVSSEPVRRPSPESNALTSIEAREKLEALKKVYDENVISEDEYNSAREKIISRIH